jgi:hypothetical protein
MRYPTVTRFVATTAILVTIGLWSSCFPESTVEYYRTMTIDPETLKVSFSDAIWFGAFRKIQGDYYESRINVAVEPHRRSVTHFERFEKALPVILNQMMISADRKLIWRDKTGLLAQLHGVTFLARSFYGYADEYRRAPPKVLVVAETVYRWQPPKEEQRLTASASLKVTGAALVRLLKQADGGVVVGSANYGLDGEMKALATRSLHNGQVDHSTVTIQLNGQAFPNGTTFVNEPGKLDAFGFPEQFRILEYLRDPRRPSSLTVTPSMVDFVVIEYDINNWFRLDQYAPGTPAMTRILHFKELPEDTMLAPIDHRGWKDCPQ